jgi:FixJ family two-component response regulator
MDKSISRAEIRELVEDLAETTKEKKYLDLTLQGYEHEQIRQALGLGITANHKIRAAIARRLKRRDHFLAIPGLQSFSESAGQTPAGQAAS